ncbi:MAG: glycosyl hydrolase family 17 protein [Bacteroidales bacterium]|jgi:exo-beta-1,3-glucanase (GH17 family)|nr:glycosyl hydrolase family 17 protein [Bacteroidales bacterium]
MKFFKYLLYLLILIGMITCQRTNESDRLKQDRKDLVDNRSRAVCYSGFRSGQHPDRGNGAINPGYEEVLEDLTILAHHSDFHLIRVYDSGENSRMVLKVIEENDLEIKVMLGIWLRAEISTHETCEWLTEPIPEQVLLKNKVLNREEIHQGIQLANQYKDIIIAVNVGNEALVDWNDHKVSPDTIISYVKEVKQSIEQPVTVAENYKWWADHGMALAEVVDFVSIHTYPLWEGKDINQGMDYTIENVLEVRNALPGARLVISEAGWTTVASEFGDRASEEKQKIYFEALMKWAASKNITTFFFEAFDEDWKGDPGNMMGAEKHWGLFTVDRKPKKVMEKYYSLTQE